MRAVTVRPGSDVPPYAIVPAPRSAFFISPHSRRAQPRTFLQNFNVSLTSGGADSTEVARPWRGAYDRLVKRPVAASFAAMVSDPSRTPISRGGSAKTDQLGLCKGRCSDGI